MTRVVIQLGLHQGLIDSLLSEDARERAEALIYTHLGLDKALARALEDEPEPYDQEDQHE